MESRGGPLVLAVGLFAVAFLLSSSNATALNQSMDVIMNPSDLTGDIGDVVTITIHVFEFGSHSDASLTVTTRARTLSTVHTGTGVYTATFTIQASDCAFGYVVVTAAATIGSVSDTAYAYVELPWFVADLFVPVTHADPGQTVDVTARFTNNGTLVDPATVSIQAYVYAPGVGDVTQDLTLTHQSLGTYTGSYVVPPNLLQAGSVDFSAVAAWSGLSAYDDVSIEVGGPRVLTAWYRPVSVGLSTATVDLYAANATGWPVVGASVTGSYTYYTGTTQTGTMSGTTDARGVARLTLSYPGSLYGVSFWGTATSGSTSGGFRGYLARPSTNLVVIEDPLSQVFAPGSAASLQSTFYLSGQPVASATVYYYVYSNSVTVTSGQVTTDANGRIAISFLMPSDIVHVDYAANVGGTWYYGSGYVYSHPLSATHDTVHAGSVLHVSVPSLPVPMRTVGFYFQGPATGQSYQQTWSLAGGSWVSGDVVFPTGNSVQYSLQLPRSLPKGEDYYLTVTGLPVDPAVGTYRYTDRIRIDNLPPVAAAVSTPPTASPSESVTLDASSSTDADGSVVAYRYAWGDGATTDWTSNASASHAYANPGDYAVTVSVRDDSGAEDSTTLTVRVQSSTNLLLILGLVVGAVVVGLVALLLVRRRRPPAAVYAPPTVPPASPAPGVPPFAPPPAMPPPSTPPPAPPPGPP